MRDRGQGLRDIVSGIGPLIFSIILSIFSGSALTYAVEELTEIAEHDVSKVWMFFSILTFVIWFVLIKKLLKKL